MFNPSTFHPIRLRVSVIKQIDISLPAVNYPPPPAYWLIIKRADTVSYYSRALYAQRCLRWISEKLMEGHVT